MVGACADPTGDLELVGSVVASDIERTAGLDRPQDADQALNNAVSLGDATGEVLLRGRGSCGKTFEVDVGAAGLRRQGLGIEADRLGGRGDELVH